MCVLCSLCVWLVYFLFFFFKQKTAYEMRISDWSSDVCSSDLNAFAALPDGKRYAQEILPDGKDDGSAFARYAAWQATGDKTWLDALHADAIAEKSQSQYMYTEGHWWSDRVDQPNETLQRERPGGIALKRNPPYPGNALGWRFADPDGAEGGRGAGEGQEGSVRLR